MSCRLATPLRASYPTCCISNACRKQHGAAACLSGKRQVNHQISLYQTRDRMKTTPAMASIAVVLLATPLHSGGIKKWVDEDGNISFGDVPPPGAIKTETIKRHVPGPRSAASDYYSPQNQLHRMRANKTQEDFQRRQKKKTARQHELSRQQAIMRRHNAEKDKQRNMARCSQYRAKIDEFEHKTIQAYSNKSDRLSDKSHLETLRKLETEHCK